MSERQNKSMSGGDGGGLNRACVLLITISGMERFAFKGVASNMVSYLTDVMKMSNSSAAKFVNGWVGFTWMLPLLVATLADSYWDRYTTILASAVLYSAGLLALTSTSVRWPWNTTSTANEARSISSLSLSLYMISLGQGAYNPSLQAFGADQLPDEQELPLTSGDSSDENKSGESSDNKSSEQKTKFFQWWYFGICCGSLLGVSVMSYIQDNLGWGLGFAIPTILMIVSIVMFACASRVYVRKPDKKNVASGNKSFEYIVRVVKATVSKMISCWNFGTMKNEYAIVDELELQEKVSLCNDDLQNGNVEKEEERVHPLESAKIVLRLLPVWLMLLPFAVIFQQPATFFTKQGMTMTRNVGSTFKIPPAALQSSITVSVIILMPFYNKLFVPLVRVFTRDKKGISVMLRMGIGMFLSVIAMAIAALTEEKRLDISQKFDLVDGDVPFSIFWLLPQYVLLGISDIFTVVGMQEFFYSEVPPRMKTMGLALYASVFGFGSFLSAIFISVIENLTSHGNAKEGNWFSDDMTKARLDKYYWFLSFTSVLSLVSFVVFSKCYRARTT